MLSAKNLNNDEEGWVRMSEFYDPALYRVGVLYLTRGEVYEGDYDQLNIIQKNTVMWLKRVVKKVEVGTNTEVADE